MTKFHLFSQDSVRLDEVSENISVILCFPRPGRCGLQPHRASNGGKHFAVQKSVSQRSFA